MSNVAVLMISSKILTGIKRDEGRADLEQMIHAHDMKLTTYRVVADDRGEITTQLIDLCDSAQTDLVLTVGGTGVRPADWAPEATKDVIEKEVPGIGEAMRAESLKKVRTAMLSRGIAGIRGRTLIVNLPGSARGARENLVVLLPILDHTIGKLSGESVMSQ